MFDKDYQSRGWNKDRGINKGKRSSELLKHAINGNPGSVSLAPLES